MCVCTELVNEQQNEIMQLNVIFCWHKQSQWPTLSKLSYEDDRPLQVMVNG